MNHARVRWPVIKYRDWGHNSSVYGTVCNAGGFRAEGVWEILRLWVSGLKQKHIMGNQCPDWLQRQHIDIEG